MTRPEFLTVAEFAEALGISVGAVERLHGETKIRIGTLDGVRVVASADLGRAEFARITGNWPALAATPDADVSAVSDES